MAAVAAVLLAGAPRGDPDRGSGQASGVTYVDGDTSQLVYAAGHRAQVARTSPGPRSPGHRSSFASYRGKVVVLNFWGSWCAPCRAEGPTLAVLSQQYRLARGLVPRRRRG